MTNTVKKSNSKTSKTQKRKSPNVNNSKINNKIKEVKTNLSSKIRKNTRVLFIVAFLFGISFIIATYAWFSVSLNVKIKFFDMTVSSDSGIFISLDGINFSDSVEINSINLIDKLTETYPNHSNQWSGGGLWPVSSNGIKTSNDDKFAVFNGQVVKPKGQNRSKKRYLMTNLASEATPSKTNSYIGFDLFLKNVSGSPNNDNLFLNEDTFITFGDEVREEDIPLMSGIMNSIRFGFVKIGSVPTKSLASDIQNIKCNNNCQSIIYEPNSTFHSEKSILTAQEHDYILKDGDYIDTYGVINAGEYLEHRAIYQSVDNIDKEHFALQNTITIDDFEDAIFQIPNGITKFRVYVWIEGQDIDSLETYSLGAAINLGIGFEKDLAGYN